MPRPSAFAAPGTNHLLSILPADDLRDLSARLSRVTLRLRQVLSEPGEAIRQVYFPLDVVVSLVTVLANGEGVEAGLVGNEGVVGVAVLLEAISSPSEAVCQVQGDALRMDADAFLAAATGNLPLRYVLLRYTQALLGQTAQSVACNRLDALDQRCARWLLSVHDRVRADYFPLTQEYLAQMLGVRRPGVSEAAQALQAAGWIDYRRGPVTVVDRAGLEAAACECYQRVRDEYERLLGVDSPVVAQALARGHSATLPAGTGSILLGGRYRSKLIGCSMLAFAKAVYAEAHFPRHAAGRAHTQPAAGRAATRGVSPVGGELRAGRVHSE